MRHYVLLGTRLLLIAVAGLYAFGIDRPPLIAQDSLTTTVMVNQEKVREVDNHLKSTDDNVTKLAESVNKALEAQANSISLLQQEHASQQGEERVLTGIIGLIASASLVIQVRRKKEGE